MAQFKFTDEYQDLLIACCIGRSAEFEWVADELKPEYFTGVQATLVAKCASDYRKAYNRYPTWPVVRELISREIAKLPDRDVGAAYAYVDRVRSLDTVDWEHVRDNTIAFIRERAYVVALQTAVKWLQEDKVPDTGLTPLFDAAGRVCQNLDDIGYIFHADVDRVVAQVTSVSYGVPTGYDLLDKIWRHGWGPGWLIVPLAPPKRFKCLGRGTPVMMADGSVRAIEDIKPGDFVMGDDLKPRRVSTSGKGFGKLYRVEQSKAMTYVCNDVHVLCVMDGNGIIREVTAEEFSVELVTTRSISRIWKGYKVDATRSTLLVTPAGQGEYFGITIDGNERFLLGDTTVTHNTAFAINLACNMVSPLIGADVLYYPCEISQELAMVRAMCNMARLTTDYMYESPEKFSQSVKEAMKEACAGNLIFKSFPSKAAKISDIRAHAKTVIRQFDLKVKAVVIDYAETVSAGDVGKNDPEYRRSAAVYTEARALGSELGCAVIMPDRCNRATTEAAVPDMTSFQGAFEKAGIVDVALGLCIHGDQSIITNRGPIKISRIGHTLKTSADKLLALSHNFSTGEDEWKPILNWFNNGASKAPFVRIKTDARNPVMNPQRSPGSTTTPEHQFFRLDGSKVEAQNLSVGDEISASVYALSEDQKQVLLGTLMGDGHISQKDGALRIAHGERQKYYLLWKLSVFSNLSTSTGHMLIKSRRYGSVTMRDRHASYMIVCGSSEIHRMRMLFYPRGIKRVPPVEVLNSLNALGLAVWFMDDATVEKTDRIKLCTNGFTKKEQGALVKWFSDRWNLIGRVDEAGAIRFNANSTRKILSLLSKYMRRNTHRNATCRYQETKEFLCPKTELGEIKLGKACVTEVSGFQLQKRLQKRLKFDIEVADNHNYYLASGALVSNCSTPDEYAANILRQFVFLNRHGPAFQHLRGPVDPTTWRIEINEEIPYEPDSKEDGDDKPRRRGRRSEKDIPDELS